MTQSLHESAANSAERGPPATKKPAAALIAPAILANLLSLLFLLTATAVAAGPAAADAQPHSDHPSNHPTHHLRIAAWNIEWLDATPGEGRVPRQAGDYAALAAIAEALDADVVALQEVEGPEAAALVFDPAEYRFFFSKRSRAQRTGFAVRRDLEVLEAGDFLALSLDDRVRRGVEVTIEVAGRPFILLSVHLKSFCFEGHLDRSDDCRTFARQVPILEAWIDEHTEEGGAFAVLGDFNRRFDAPGGARLEDGSLADEVWADLDDGEPAGLDLVRANDDLRSACEGGRYPLFIDHLVLDEEAAAWLVPGSFGQLVSPPEAVARYKLSDHCPIFVDLEVPARSDAGAGAGESAGDDTVRDRLQ